MLRSDNTHMANTYHSYEGLCLWHLSTGGDDIHIDEIPNSRNPETIICVKFVLGNAVQ